MWWLILCITLAGLQGLRYLVTHYFCVWERLWTWAFESGDSCKVVCLPKAVVIIQPRTEHKGRKRKEGFCRSCLHAWSRCLLYLLPPSTILGRRPSSLDWNLTVSTPGSQALCLGLNYSTSLPGSPAHRWQFMGLFSFHNCVSQLRVINLFLYPSGSVSREPWDTNWYQELGDAATNTGKGKRGSGTG